LAESLLLLLLLLLAADLNDELPLLLGFSFIVALLLSLGVLGCLGLMFLLQQGCRIVVAVGGTIVGSTVSVGGNTDGTNVGSSIVGQSVVAACSDGDGLGVFGN